MVRNFTTLKVYIMVKNIDNEFCKLDFWWEQNLLNKIYDQVTFVRDFLLSVNINKTWCGVFRLYSCVLNLNVIYFHSAFHVSSPFILNMLNIVTYVILCTSKGEINISFSHVISFNQFFLHFIFVEESKISHTGFSWTPAAVLSLEYNPTVM